MSVSFYMDHDSGTHAVVQGLRSGGVDVLTSEEPGNQRLDDARQLEFAARQGRCLYTGNLRDFASLHAGWMRTARAHQGIVVRARQATTVGDQVRGLLAICAAFEALPMENQSWKTGPAGSNMRRVCCRT